MLKKLKAVIKSGQKKMFKKPVSTITAAAHFLKMLLDLITQHYSILIGDGKCGGTNAGCVLLKQQKQIM